MIEIRLPIGKGLAGFVAEKGETILIPDTYADPRFNPEIDKQSGYRTRNMLCMPMKNKDGKLIGVFQLLNKKEGAFDAEDVNFIDAFSAHASVAIENARLAQEMVQNERLSAVGRMASVIIHDIKNPMGTLRVYAQVMKKKSGNEEANKLADEMIRQVDRFVNMTQEILDFTRGVSASNFQDLEFKTVMDDVLSFIEKDLEKNNVKLVKNPNFEGIVTMDQDKIVRVFYNIASNARDAMPQGGTLTLTTALEGDYVRIDFKDTRNRHAGRSEKENLRAVYDLWKKTRDRSRHGDRQESDRRSSRHDRNRKRNGTGNNHHHQTSCESLSNIGSSINKKSLPAVFCRKAFNFFKLTDQRANPRPIEMAVHNARRMNAAAMPGSVRFSGKFAEPDSDNGSFPDAENI